MVRTFLVFIFIITFTVIPTTAAEHSVSPTPLITDSFSSFEKVKERAIVYMLGASGHGPYRKNAVAKTDAWVKRFLQYEFQPLRWDETAAQVMNQRLAKVAADLHRLAVAFRSDGSRFESNEDVKNRIVAGLQNILEHYNPETPRPGNWYQWLITLPNHLGATGILMEDHLPPTMLTGLKETVRHELSPELVLTGTNASWEARNHIYLALLDRDLKRLERAADYVFRSVPFGPRQGIREDYAYLFHGHIPYAGGYKTIITVHLPDDAVDNEYKLSVHFSKSQRFHDFTAEDVIDRPSRNTVRYRWDRRPAVGPPVFSEYLKLSHGNFKVMLVTELIIAEDDIKVPDFRPK